MSALMVCDVPRTVTAHSLTTHMYIHADSEAEEDASIVTMLDLLPEDVGYAVAHSFRQRCTLFIRRLMFLAPDPRLHRTPHQVCEQPQLSIGVSGRLSIKLHEHALWLCCHVTLHSTYRQLPMLRTAPSRQASGTAKPQMSSLSTASHNLHSESQRTISPLSV